MCTDMCVDMCTDMHIDMCMDMCIDTCITHTVLKLSACMRTKFLLIAVECGDEAWMSNMGASMDVGDAAAGTAAGRSRTTIRGSSRGVLAVCNTHHAYAL